MVLAEVVCEVGVTRTGQMAMGIQKKIKRRIVVYFRERSDRTVMGREEKERKRRCM